MYLIHKVTNEQLRKDRINFYKAVDGLDLSHMTETMQAVTEACKAAYEKHLPSASLPSSAS